MQLVRFLGPVDLGGEGLFSQAGVGFSFSGLCFPMSLFQCRAPPGQLGPGPGPMPADTGQQLQAVACGDLARSWSVLFSRASPLFPGHLPCFQGITPISVFSFQLPQAKVWGMSMAA